jgi:hypothetical protein
LVDCKLGPIIFTSEIKWRCINRKCTAFLKTFGINNDITEKNGDHLHEPIRCQVLQRQCVTTVAKRKGTEDICSRPNKIVYSAVNNVPDTQDLQVIFGMLKGIYTMPPSGVLWVMLKGSQKYYKKIICTFLSGSSLHLNYFYLKKTRAEFTIYLLNIFFPRAEFTIAQKYLLDIL